MNSVVINPYEYFADPTQGRPIFNGFVYIGQPDTDPEVPANQKQVYARQEDGNEVAIAQPVRTNAGGYPTYNGSVIAIVVDGPHSLKVNNKDGSQLLYSSNNYNGIATTDDYGSVLLATTAQARAGTAGVIPDAAQVRQNHVGHVATIAALRALEPAFDGQQVELLGHTIAGIGGGVFYHDAASSAADDNGVTIVTTGGKRWKRIITDSVSVSDFGALTDGVTDDGPAISAAISSGVKIITIPQGVCAFGNPITIAPGFRGIKIIGAGMINTTVKALNAGQPSFVLPYVSDSFYQELSDLTIDGNGVATEFQNASAYTLISRVRSFNHTARNYHAAGLINNHMGCVFPPNPNGVLCASETVWVSHNANYFQGCYLHGGGPTGWALRINDNNGKESVKTSFNQCTIENGKISIEDGAEAVSIDDNYLEQVYITASGNCDGLFICNNRGAEAQPFVHLNEVSRLASVKIADNNLSFDIYITVANREGLINEVLDFYQFPELIIDHNGLRQHPVLINGLVSCDRLKVQRAKIPGDVGAVRVEIIGIYAETPAETTPSPVRVASLYVRASANSLDGYFIEEKSYYRRPPVSLGGVDPYRAFYWLAAGFVEYPNTNGGTVGATERTVIYQRNPPPLPITYSISSNGASSKRWDMHITGEATRAGYISTDLKLTQIS